MFKMTVPSFTNLPLALSASALFILAYLVSAVIKYRKENGRPSYLANYPWLGSPAQMDLTKSVEMGQKQYTDENKPYVLHTAHIPMMVLPVKYINEVKSLPENQLSFHAFNYKRLMGKYVDIDIEPDHALNNAVKIDLTRNISTVLEDLQSEMQFAGDQNIGVCADWTTIPIYDRLLRIVALLSGRVFVGEELARSEDWIDITTNYTLFFFKVPAIFWTYKKWQQPFVAPFIKELKEMKTYKARAMKLLEPVFRSRMQEAGVAEKVKQRGNMTNWIHDHTAPKFQGDLDFFVRMQLSASLAAIHTTSMNATHVLFDLASNPSYFAPLREEIDSIIAADGLPFEKKSMYKMRKLDSFIKESQRLNPPGILGMNRVVMADITLSDGLVLKKGTHIAFPSLQLNMNDQTWDNPEVFDGFRFEKLRAMEGNENKYQFVTTGLDNINFGHGVHACPGRFFASNEIKLILVHLLQNYDWKFQDGSTTRPRNFVQQTAVMPNTFTKLLFKRRAGA